MDTEIDILIGNVVLLRNTDRPSIILDWLNSECDICPFWEIDTKEAYDAFVSYCGKNGKEACARHVFGAGLSRYIVYLNKVRRGVRPNSTRRKMVYQGFYLKESQWWI